MNICKIGNVLFQDVGPLDDSPRDDAAFTHTWEKPYQTMPEAKIGALGVLPPEVFKHLLSLLPLRDIGTMTATCRPINSMVRGTPSPFAALLPLVQKAWTDDVDDAQAETLLGVITTMPLALRPAALRMIGSTGSLRTKGGSGSVPDRSLLLIAATRDLVLAEVSIKDQARMLADLEVAKWFAFGSYRSVTVDAETTMKETSVTCINALPPYYWPDILDASLCLKNDVRWFDVARVIDDADIVFTSMSDRLATAFASAAVVLKGPRCFDVMQKRLGVSRAQYEARLRPQEALRVIDLRQTQDVTFAVIWRDYQPPDSTFVEHVERLALSADLPIFRLTGQVQKAFAGRRRRRDGDCVAEAEALRWTQKSLAFFNIVDPATPHPAREYSGVDGAPDCRLGNAFIDLVARLKSGEDRAISLKWILSAPVNHQPVLLERWAESFTAFVDRERYLPLLATISQWRVECVEAFVSRNAYPSAVLACVAELKACYEISGQNKQRLAPLIAAISDRIIETMPSEAWGALLDYLALRIWDLDLSTTTRAKIASWADIFLKNPLARFATQPQAYSYFLVCASTVFKDLPDRASRYASKYDQLCDRLSIAPSDRELTKEFMLRVVAERIQVDSRHLKSAIRAELGDLGFDDEASFRYVLENRRTNALTLANVARR